MLNIIEIHKPEDVGLKIETTTTKYGRSGYSVKRDNAVIAGPFTEYPAIATIKSKGEKILAAIPGGQNDIACDVEG